MRQQNPDPRRVLVELDLADVIQVMNALKPDETDSKSPELLTALRSIQRCISDPKRMRVTQE